MGAAPSHECKTFFSYFRGSYEVGLVPLSKQYFGNASYPSTEMPYEKRAVLREQIVLMRKDPAVLYANSRAGDNMRASMSPTPEEKELEKLLYDFYWDTMPQPDFTEDDLDQFLDLVDRYMYDTDRDMAEDSRYNGTAATSDTTTHKVPFFMPIPCVLCLAYPEGKERQGCFELSGRNINIIGFFGLMTREMENAFKLVKFDREREIRWTPTTTETDTTVYLQGETTGDPGSSLPKGKEQLFMSTTILTSAGDRTLERVLVLAAVMLRHQYHVACRKYGILKKTQAALTSQGTRLVPEETLMNIEGHLPHIVKASALPPLPAESFVPHPYNFMNEKAAYPPPHLRLLPAQSSLRMSMDNLAQLAVESKDSTLFSYLDSIISGAEPAATAVANTSTNFICYTPALPYAFCLTNEEENAISWGLLHRLDTLGIVIETAANNYCSLKALAENFAFLHCQVLIDPSLSHVAFTDLPVNTVTPQEEADRYNGKHVVLSPSSAIVISLQPKYVRQATLWAASLFHRPTGPARRGVDPVQAQGRERRPPSGAAEQGLPHCPLAAEGRGASGQLSRGAHQPSVGPRAHVAGGDRAGEGAAARALEEHLRLCQ
ncbi:hypothetical protein ADEAN_000269800 [Angomonas deanei]|uniref:Uncharacterized protein n=1 Tax=Angomonas deanei TaxID=59799 RepID=A0A7G2C903_9TRYP|nr:hypothetical protein ADEAN_000269800 [Angomonas deanei]